MAEQLKYRAEDNRISLGKTEPMVLDLELMLEELGANGEYYFMRDSGAFEYNGKYEVPRKGAVLFHIKEFAERPGALVKLPEKFNYNILVDFLGFKEDTKKYKEIKSTIESIIEVDYFQDTLYRIY